MAYTRRNFVSAFRPKISGKNFICHIDITPTKNDILTKDAAVVVVGVKCLLLSTVNLCMNVILAIRIFRTSWPQPHFVGVVIATGEEGRHELAIQTGVATQ